MPGYSFRWGCLQPDAEGVPGRLQRPSKAGPLVGRSAPYAARSPLAGLRATVRSGLPSAS
jgi:hypothetical protein